MKKNSLHHLRQIAEVIQDKKGRNVLALDVAGLSSLTDYMILAEGNVDRHVIAMARAITERLQEQEHIAPLRSEGLSTGDWVILDYGDVMVHLFQPGLREKYALERLWTESQIVDLESPSEENG